MPVMTPRRDFNIKLVHVRVMTTRFLSLPVQVAFENDATATLFLPFAEMFHPKRDDRPEVRQLNDRLRQDRRLACRTCRRRCPPAQQEKQAPSSLDWHSIILWRWALIVRSVPPNAFAI